MSDLPTLLTEDDPGVLSAFGGPQWGIFTPDGAPILTVDSVASIEYARDYRVSNYPQEQGGFQSYNKVQVPFQAKVGFLIGPSRSNFLSGIEMAVQSLDLVSVITPEISYPSANLTHYGYRREVRNGRTLIRVDVWCEEIRIAGSASFGGSPLAKNGASTNPIGQTNQAGKLTTQSTNGASPTQSGQVQPISPIPPMQGPAGLDFPTGGIPPMQGPAGLDFSTGNTSPDLGPLTPPT